MCVQGSFLPLYDGSFNVGARDGFAGSVNHHHLLPFDRVIHISKLLIIEPKGRTMCVTSLVYARGFRFQDTVNHLETVLQDLPCQHPWFFGQVVCQLWVHLNLVKAVLCTC